MIPFGEWLPDLADFENPGVTEAKNVLPAGNSYKSFPSLAVYSDALTARCQGAVSGRDNDGNSYNFAGDASKLYSMSDAAWEDVSVAGGYTTGSTESWQFAQYGEDLIATNFADNPQKYTMGTSTDFENLTTAVKFRYTDSVREFLVVGNTNDATDGNVPHRVRWSAAGDHTDWTVAAATQADYQDLNSAHGWIYQVVGGEYGVIFQERAITRMSYEGSPTVFRFDAVETNRGTQFPNSVIKFGNKIAYLGEEGFYIFDGAQSTPIGADKIDKTFYAELDQSNKERVIGTIDPINKILFWAYPTVDGGANPAKILAFNYSPNATKRWSYAELDVETIFRSISEGYTLEGLDSIYSSIEDVPVSLDSRVWTGGTVYLSGFNTAHKLCTFTGSALTAVLETQEAQLTPGRRTRVNKVRPVIDGSGTITVQMGERDLHSESVSWQSSSSVNSTGDCSVRSNARYHRARFTIAGGFTHAQGMEIVEAFPGGKR